MSDKPQHGQNWWKLVSVVLLPLILGAYIFGYTFTVQAVGQVRQDLIEQLRQINNRLTSIEEHLRRD